jgi:hypothetical protein
MACVQNSIFLREREFKTAVRLSIIHFTLGDRARQAAARKVSRSNITQFIIVANEDARLYFIIYMRMHFAGEADFYYISSKRQFVYLPERGERLNKYSQLEGQKELYWSVRLYIRAVIKFYLFARIKCSTKCV